MYITYLISHPPALFSVRERATAAKTLRILIVVMHKKDTAYVKIWAENGSYIRLRLHMHITGTVPRTCYRHLGPEIGAQHTVIRSLFFSISKDGTLGSSLETTLPMSVEEARVSVSQ